jgi:hypothetical protein
LFFSFSIYFLYFSQNCRLFRHIMLFFSFTLENRVFTPILWKVKRRCWVFSTRLNPIGIMRCLLKVRLAFIPFRGYRYFSGDTKDALVSVVLIGNITRTFLVRFEVI